MATAIAIPSSAFFLPSNKILLRYLSKSPVSTARGRQRCTLIAVKAVGDGSESSSSSSIVKYVENAWSSTEDRIGLVGLGFAAIVAVWASSNLIGAIDKLPVIPGVLEFIGILFSWWFVYRYLLFNPDREELLRNVKSSVSKILGR